MKARILQLIAFLLSFFKSPPRDDQGIMFKATFVTMGYIASCDQLLQKCELLYLKEVQGYLNLNKEKIEESTHYFEQGVEGILDLESTLRSFKEEADASLIQLFLSFQLKMIYADGHLDQEEYGLIYDIYNFLGVSDTDYARIHRETWTHCHFEEKRKVEFTTFKKPSNPKQETSPLHLAYSTLGVESTVTRQGLKKAYRKLLKENHPDKLIARGLPEEMIKLAEEKVGKIYDAYHLIQTLMKSNLTV